MEKILLTKENGYQIPCIAEFPVPRIAENPGSHTEGTPPDCRISAEMGKVVIVIHGYDSSKESENAANLMRVLSPQGFGVIAYDQPNHGSEEAAEEELSIDACLDSLAKVEEYLTERFPDKEICYFGSSFGAYILGIYLTSRPHSGHKAFMRCAAVNFPELDLDDRAKALEPVDLFRLFDQAKPENVEIAFAHGELDSSVPVEAALDFAHRYGYPITVFPGEEHPICTYPENPGKVAALAAELYRSCSEQSCIDHAQTELYRSCLALAKIGNIY